MLTCSTSPKLIIVLTDDERRIIANSDVGGIALTPHFPGYLSELANVILGYRLQLRGSLSGLFLEFPEESTMMLISKSEESGPIKLP